VAHDASEATPLGPGSGVWLATGDGGTSEGDGAGPPQAVTATPTTRTTPDQRGRPPDETTRDDVA